MSLDPREVIITPVEGSRPTLEQRLAAFDPKRHGGEQMAPKGTLGAEHW